MKMFRIIYEVDLVLSEKQVWPNGDGPADPTSQDVVDVFSAYKWRFDDQEDTLDVLEISHG